MRLTIAAAILAQALPATSDTNNANIHLARDERKQRIQSLLNKPAEGRHQLLQKLKGGGRSSMKVLRKKHFNQGVLKNDVVMPQVVAVECDPTLSASADVGLLSCGMGKYCVESVESSLGGHCLSPQRNDVDRQLVLLGTATTELCNASSPNYQYYDCDCDGFDSSAGVGNIECQLYESFCLEDCNTTCTSVDVTYSLAEDSLSYGYCYNFFAPYDQSVCFDYTYTPEAITCSVNFNDGECDSCLVEHRNYELYNVTCLMFDCTNVGGLVGNLCDDSNMFPIVKDCYYYDECNICGDGSLVDPGLNVTLPGVGEYICSDLYTFGIGGYLPEIICPIAQDAAADVCCSIMDTPSPAPSPPVGFVCQICGEGKMISKPDGVVLIPTQPERTCAEVQAGAEVGAITEAQCPLLTGFVNGPCQCVDSTPTDPPTPTEPMPTNPPVDPTASPVAEPTPAPTDGGSGLLSVNNAASLVGLSVAMLIYFAA